MSNLFNRIIRMFASSAHGQALTDQFHRWLVDEEHAEEKKAALEQLWEETNAKADASTRRSLYEVYEKTGVTPLERKQNAAVHRLTISWWRVAAAAVVLVCLSVGGTLFLSRGFFGDVEMVEQYAKVGDTRTVLLPDGTEVLVNSTTLLLYPEEFRGSTRTVYLMGEANFKVKKNARKPFIVSTSQVDVTALGTEFNVSAYPDQDEVVATLLQGKVRVDCNEQKQYILHPGQQVTYLKSSGESRLTDANLKDVTAWQRGMNVFRSKTVAEILEVLSRRFDVNLHYNVKQCSGDRYNFSFRKESNLPQIMAILKDVVEGFDYQMKDNEYTIRMK